MFDYRQRIALLTIVTKEIRRFMRIWIQTLVPPVITIVLYFIIFGNLIGKRIGDMSGHSYMQFVMPGLIMLAIINNAYSNVVSSFYGAKFQRYIEELLVTPTAHWVVLSGFVLGGITRALLVGLIVMLISLFFTPLSIHNMFVVFGIAVMTATLFALCGFINAIYANTFDDISIIPTFVLTPLIYLGGVFYSIELLPDFWQKVSLLNPVIYMVNAFRYGVLGVSDIEIGRAFLMIALFIVIAACYSLYLLKTGKRIKT